MMRRAAVLSKQAFDFQIASLATLLVAVALTLTMIPAQAKAPTKPSEFVLTNGLRIVVVPDHRVPIVTHMVFYRIGSVDEQPDENGVAHYLEHLMFKGTKAFPRGEFDRVVMRGGGVQNATTSHDSTVYYQRMPRRDLERLMALEADRMENLEIDDAAAKTERSIVKEEFLGTSNQPGLPFHYATAGALYGDHGYARAPIGTEASIAVFNAAGAMRFYRRHYRPQRAIVVIGGDVTEEEVRNLAERTYGRVAKRDDEGEADRTLPSLASTAQRVVVPHPRVSATLIRRTFLTSSARDMPLMDATALNLFSYIVGNGALSRLHEGLVVKGIASASGSSLDLRRYGGTLSFEATALPGTKDEALESAFDRILAEVAANGVTQHEFDEMKLRFLATRVYDEDNTASRSQTIGHSLLVGWSLDDVLGFKQRVENVTLEDVNRVGRNLLVRARSVTGLLVPQSVAQTGKAATSSKSANEN
jgi:zinc protease